jgi:hypothetical protein
VHVLHPTEQAVDVVATVAIAVDVICVVPAVDVVNIDAVDVVAVDVVATVVLAVDVICVVLAVDVVAVVVAAAVTASFCPAEQCPEIWQAK